MLHTDHDPTGARKQPEQTGSQQQENSELMSFENQPSNDSREESELLKNAMNPLESRTAKPSINSDERKLEDDQSQTGPASTVPPNEEGFINIDAED